MCVAISEEAPLKHFIRRETYSVDKVHGIEGRLLYFGKKILGIAVKLEYADIVKRKILVIPHFGKVKRIYVICFGLILGHELHLEFPFGEIPALDSLEQVALVRFAVFGNNFLSLAVSKVFYSLKCAEMKLDPGPLVILVYEAVSMAAESVHV